MSISDDMGATGAGSTGGSQGQGTPMPQGRETAMGGEGGAAGVTQTLKNVGSDIGNYASNKASQLKDTAQEYYQTGREKAQEYMHMGADKAQEYMHAGADKAQEYYEMSRQKAVELEQNVESYIREKPLQSVLIAAGVGAVIGFMLRR